MGISSGSGSEPVDSRRAGKWMRIDITWSDIAQGDTKPASGSYTWTSTDTKIQNAIDAGLRIYGGVTYAPKWANGGQSDNKYPPNTGTNRSEMAAFLVECINRYHPDGDAKAPFLGSGQGVKYWGLWNEPNNPNFWKPSPSVAAYTDLINKCWTSIQAWRASHSGSILRFGILETSPMPTTNRYNATSWLTDIYAWLNALNGNDNRVWDFITHHGYWNDKSAGTNEKAVLAINQSWNPGDKDVGDPARNDNAFLLGADLYQILSNKGDSDCMVWYTETGNAIDANNTEADVAAQIQIALDQWFGTDTPDGNWDAWRGPFFWWTIKDPTNPVGYGLIDSGGTDRQTMDVMESNRVLRAKRWKGF